MGSVQVYESLQAEGYLVDYERIPITDEKSPKERDFDSLVSSLLKLQLGVRGSIASLEII